MVALLFNTLTLPASETVVGAVSVPRLIRSLRLHPAESSQVRVRAFPLLFSASASGLGVHQHPPPPNNSFKPTPHRGVNSVLCATLARCRRPAVGRLNSSVRRQKSVWWFCFSTRQLYRLRLALLFGQIVGTLLLRSSPSGALTHRVRYVGRLRTRWLARSVFRG